jgi:hypothetical protein
MEYNVEFWNALDILVQQSEVVIDRPKETADCVKIKKNTFLCRIHFVK